MKINKEWHRKNPMPKRAPLSLKIQWHVDHHRECSCREIPKSIQAKLAERKPKLVVGILAKHKNKYLLAQEILEGGKSYWIVPGGKVEFGETIEAAAKRELEEETGLVANKLNFLAYKEAIAEKYNYHTVIFFFETDVTTTELKDDIEGKVIEAKWFTRKEALELDLVFSAKWLFQEIVLK